MHLIVRDEGKFGGHDPNSREFSHVPEFPGDTILVPENRGKLVTGTNF